MFLILSPIVNVLDNGDILKEVENAIEAMSKEASKNNNNEAEKIDIDYDQDKALKQSYIENIKVDLKNKVKKYGYIYIDSYISVSVKYEIQSITLNIKKDLGSGEDILEIGTISNIIKEISDDYNIEQNNIKISKVGGEND